MSDAVLAKFSSSCPECVELINAGDLIVETDAGWAHARCVELEEELLAERPFPSAEPTSGPGWPE